jgi:thiol:disulfide interchange protein DsbD
LPQRPLRRPDARRRRFVAGVVAAVALGAAWPAVAPADPLPPEKAFRFSAQPIDARTVEARFQIADGYYLYRDRIHFAVEPATAGLTPPTLPVGAIKEDPFFGQVETYRGNVVIKLALTDPQPGQRVVITAESQGCADIGLCYPPTVQRVPVALPQGGVTPAPASQGSKQTQAN